MRRVVCRAFGPVEDLEVVDETDPVPGPASESALRALRPSGRFAVLGFTSGEIPKLPANIVLIGNHAVIGVDWGDWARADPAAATALVADLLARRAVTGKIALVPG